MRILKWYHKMAFKYTFSIFFLHKKRGQVSADSSVKNCLVNKEFDGFVNIWNLASKRNGLLENKPCLRNIFFIFLSFYSFIQISGQGFGINLIPENEIKGEIPYEMKGRKDNRMPLVTFDDCSSWIVKTKNAVAKLNRTQEQRIISSEYAGKLTFTSTSPVTEIRLELNQSVKLDFEWDCVNMWAWGDHSAWMPEALKSVVASAIIRDAKGKEHHLTFAQFDIDAKKAGNMGYHYWFLLHVKLQEQIPLPAELVGLIYKGNNTEPGKSHRFYLGPVYVYKEVLNPVSFKALPEKLPFPLRRETILPINKEREFKNSVEKMDMDYLFHYKGKDAFISYKVNIEQPIGNISMLYQGNWKKIDKGGEIIFLNNEKVTWNIYENFLRGDTLFVKYKVVSKDFTTHFNCFYTISQKSLVWNIEEISSEGHVEEVRLGETGRINQGKLVNIPFLVYNGLVKDFRPSILCADGLFYFSMFDWYYANGSINFPGEKGIRNGYATYNGGVKYIPKTDGVRNPLRERLFITVSPDVQEVFPTIDNPPSPMREAQADRLWTVMGGPDVEGQRNQIRKLRAMGLEKVSIHFHEDYWRAGSESFTLRTEPNPNLGEERLKEQVEFVKSQDWRVGFYTNYCDYAPVNAKWNEDWVRREPDGEWATAWERCYNIKPSKAWEMEAYFAPQIHKKFNTNFSYCDVHTSISPMKRVDYDYRAPGAAMYRSTFEYWGLLLHNEKNAYQGPVYSEGYNHWWFAGLVDGNYANDKELRDMVIFPDFQLLKLHPLEMDGGNNGNGYEYLSYTLAYGNLGMITAEPIERYAFLQPLQRSYVMVPVREIAYHDGETFTNSSQAVIRDLINAPRLRLFYESGLMVYVNFSKMDWEIEVNGEVYILPNYGFLAFLPAKKLMSYSVVNKDSQSKSRIDRVFSEKLYFIKTNGETASGELAGKGSYMLKYEKFGWEIIPVEELTSIDFSTSLLGMENYGFNVEAVSQNGEAIRKVNELPLWDRINFEHDGDAFKYRITPVVSSPKLHSRSNVLY